MKNCFNQPAEWKFIDDLKKPQEIYLQWKKPERQLEPDIQYSCEDPEELLKSAVDSLRNFMRTAIPFHFPVRIRLLKRKWKLETYELETDRKSAVISSCDLEGLRRGIYNLIDLWKGASGPNLPKQKIRKSPWLKNRISRFWMSRLTIWMKNISLG